MSGVGQDSKPERESQVRAAQAKLDETIDRAEKAVLSLFSRIESVTRPDMPKTQGPPVSTEPTSDLVVLAKWINDKTACIKRLAHAIEDTQGRVEL